MKRALLPALVAVLAMVACGMPAAAPAGPSSSIFSAPDIAPAATPEPFVIPAGTQTAIAAQATFVAARASVTAAAQNVQATSTTVAQATVGAAGPDLSIKEIADLGRQAVVWVSRSSGGGGSGAYLGDGRMLTAAHVVNGAPAFSVVYAGKNLGAGDVAGIDIPHDVALITSRSMDSSGAQSLKWGDPTTLHLGDPLVVIGYPLGIGSTTAALGVGPTITQGIVSAHRQLGDVHLIQTDAAVNPGNSGGPILNGQGRLVAIASFAYCQRAGLNFGVTAETARPFVEHPIKSVPSSSPLVSSKPC